MASGFCNSFTYLSKSTHLEGSHLSLGKTQIKKDLNCFAARAAPVQSPNISSGTKLGRFRKGLMGTNFNPVHLPVAKYETIPCSFWFYKL